MVKNKAGKINALIKVWPKEENVEYVAFFIKTRG